MAKFKNTAEQDEIVKAATETRDNLAINALAGAAKTSSLALIAKALPKEDILCLAFNKAIAQEMEKGFPKNCTCINLNAFGHRTWQARLSGHCRVNTRKYYKILATLINASINEETKQRRWSEYRQISTTFLEAYTAGYVPPGKHESRSLIMPEDFFATTVNVLRREDENLVNEALTLSIEESFKGTLHFPDQLYMPTLFGAPWPRPSVTLIDEAQDLSPLDHKMLEKVVKTRRIILVGDSHQAIYGFRGASGTSLQILSKKFDCAQLSLTTSFRCAKRIVESARWHAPAMRYPDWAIEGEVKTLTDWAISDLPQTAFVLCRNNAPLFRLAIVAISQNRYPRLGTGDIIKGLMKIIKTFKLSSRTSIDQFLDNINIWEHQQKQKTRNHGAIEDQAECLRILTDNAKTVNDVSKRLETLLHSDGSLELLTGHKAKGRETDHVFILDRNLIKSERAQDSNVLYVMQTRAKKSLTYVETGNLIDKLT